MSDLTWDNTGERFYETGVDRGVLYVIQNGTYQTGVAWNGLSSVSESPSGGEASAIYADNIKYLNLISTEEFGASVEAYTYPEEFAACDGSTEIATGVIIGQQTRLHFGLCYRTIIGNDVESNDYGYKIHIVYDCLASPSEKGYSTVNDSPEAITFSWEISTTPINVEDYKAIANLIIDSTKVDADKLAALEEILYGSETTEPRLPLPDEIIELLSNG
ncbi:MAG: hypothetical protein LIO74_12040 [Ruminococcus sp.]|nr:hypothetical protein [Ruminococcus sp.]